MTPEKNQIVRKTVPAGSVVSVCLNIRTRAELHNAIREVRERIAETDVAGPPFCQFNFISGFAEGFDVEVGFPVRTILETDGLSSRMIPQTEVLSIVHSGPVSALRETRLSMHEFASRQGYISDEFNREIYLDWGMCDPGRIELQFIIHPWARLLEESIARVSGEDLRHTVVPAGLGDHDRTTALERFHAVRNVVSDMKQRMTEKDRYEILSRCAHVFPEKHIVRLKAAFVEVKERTGDGLQAVDAVLKLMEHDPAWGEVPRREGYIIYSAKNPRDPAAYSGASTAAEKARAYCFCPLIQDYLDEGMPVDFCYCGAGWFRRQWEGATGKPVRIEIIRSLLKGDERCEFAIHLAEDL